MSTGSGLNRCREADKGIGQDKGEGIAKGNRKSTGDGQDDTSGAKGIGKSKGIGDMSTSSGLKRCRDATLGKNERRASQARALALGRVIGKDKGSTMSTAE